MRKLGLVVLGLGLMVSTLFAVEPVTDQATTVAPVAAQLTDDPVKTDTPRDTMRSFYRAMQDYKKGLDTHDVKLQERINDAIRCFDLNGLPVVGRRQTAVQAAIYLKEIIDRWAVLDYDKIPDSKDKPIWNPGGGRFVIRQMKDGDQEGQYLISAQTVNSLPEIFEEVKGHAYVKGGGQGAGYRAPWLERHVPQWSFDRFLGLAYWQWIGIAVAILVGLMVRMILHGIFRLCLNLTRHVGSKWHSILIKTLTSPVALVLTAIFWWAAIYLLHFNGNIKMFFTGVVQIILGLAVIWTMYRMVGILQLALMDYVRRENSRLDEHLVHLIVNTLKVVVIIFGILVLAQTLGVQVLSVLAGLGIGGLALALAAKDTLANFFGSVMIMIDRPFRVGDFIKVKDQEGTVEAIGFRSTKIRTPHNSLVSIPSGELSTASVDNLGMRHFRRVRSTLGVTYQTTPQQMTDFIEGIKRILSAHPRCQDNYLVSFTEFSSSSLDVLVNFFLDVPDLPAEAAEKQRIFLEIMQLAERLGVSFAFPSQSLYIEKTPDGLSRA